MELGFVGDTIMTVIAGMHALFGLEGMVGVLIGFLLYALYNTVKGQFFKIMIIGIFVIIVWGVAVYIGNGEAVSIPAFNDTVTSIIQTNSTVNQTQISTT